MAEGVDWLCDHLQYYGLAKPIFFLKYKTDDASIESMFLRCLKYAAGYSSYAPAAASKDLYALYRPLLERLFRRRWVFDPDPLNLPEGFDGGLYRSRGGSLLARSRDWRDDPPGRKVCASVPPILPESGASHCSNRAARCKKSPLQSMMMRCNLIFRRRL
jgi:hypothetical protein